MLKKQIQVTIMKSNQIQKLLKENNINYSMVAEALNVTPAHVRNVAEGIFVSYRVAEAIAAAVGLPMSDVFPSYPQESPASKKEKRRKTVAHLKKKFDQRV